MISISVMKPPKPRLEVNNAISHVGENVEFMCIRQSRGGSQFFEFFKGINHLAAFGSGPAYTLRAVLTSDTSSAYNCKVKVNGVTSDPSENTSLTGQALCYPSKQL